ncbi:MAG: hypothetical protein C00003105_02157 [ANME-2 cluster archaeon HR1]|jgi:hypothetical protein|nr:MAG: hypothetical protein C00003105_02157 [ANME-2 cluster archaeon HR1]
MRKKYLMYCIFIGSLLILSGCLQENNEIYLSDVDVMSDSKDDEIELKVISYIRNDQNTDSESLSIEVKAIYLSSNLVTTIEDVDIGYVKKNSQTHNTVSLIIPNTGKYEIEVLLLENGMVLDEYHTHVEVQEKLNAGQPADIVLTDMTLDVKQYVDRASNVVVDISPGIYNQGGDSEPLTMEVTASVDPYKHYIESDDLGIVKGSNHIRGNVRMILPKNSKYSFTVVVKENGNTVYTGVVDEEIELKQIKINTPLVYKIIKEGTPPVEEEPGFHGLIAFISILLIYIIIRRTKI